MKQGKLSGTLLGLVIPFMIAIGGLISDAYADGTSDQPSSELTAQSTDSLTKFYFDKGSLQVRHKDKIILRKYAEWVRSQSAEHPIKLIIAGHTDDQGSREYSIPLGLIRASSVKRVLIQYGVPEQQMETISYGKERSFCMEKTEQCRKKNRCVEIGTAPI